ncbi:amidohydrolase family protein [Streptomyces cinerochromogenes]|uniref:amidohydrolase family protein n=1 Tax=Streptomyces cinerochromogenes TaxID=66422 RepID=UPI0036C7F151
MVASGVSARRSPPARPRRARWTSAGGAAARGGRRGPHGRSRQCGSAPCRVGTRPRGAARRALGLAAPTPTDRLYYPLYAACVELGIPFCTQVGDTGSLCPSETGRPIPCIDQVALDFPGLTIGCGHIGCPWTTEMVAVGSSRATPTDFSL